ncbi:MAG: hypothetical protein R3B49_02255 [Phycisphaerales bacterium]
MSDGVESPALGQPPRVWRTGALALAALVAAVLLRVLAPSDLLQNQDQSKTIAFTMDCAVNGHWALQRDGSGELTRKPPLVNWIGAPAPMLGWHSELALKLPSLVAGVTTVVVTSLGALVLVRRVGARPADALDGMLGAHAPALAIAAGVVWLTCPESIKHIYFLRPDMVMTACLAGSWVCATVLLTGPKPKHPTALALGMWGFAGLAMLAKGPMAVLVPVYALAAGVLIADDESKATWGERVRRTARAGWWWGVPLMVAPTGAWVWAAWAADAAHVRDRLLGGELGSRIERGSTGASAGRYVRALGNVPAMFVARFLPWGVAALLALVFRPSSRWVRHPTAPASVWVLLVLVFNVLFAGRSGSFLMPAYPAAASLAVYAAARIIAGRDGRRVARAAPGIAAFALVCALVIGGREATTSRAARTGAGEHIKAFARAAERTVGDGAVVFVGIGDNPVSSLMGRHHAGDPGAEELAHAAWIVAPVVEGVDPVVSSEAMEILRARSHEARARIDGVGLYRVSDLSAADRAALVGG